MGRTEKTIRGTKPGKPDYYKSVLSSKPEISPDQLQWEDLWTGSVSAGGCETVSAYTVKEDYKLHLGGGVITCNKSGIQKVVLTHTPGILGDFRYDVRGTLILGPLTARVMDPGDRLKYYVYNNLNEEAEFSVSLTGTLMRVRG